MTSKRFFRPAENRKPGLTPKTVTLGRSNARRGFLGVKEVRSALRKTVNRV